jgi:hypothetical protein
MNTFISTTIELCGCTTGDADECLKPIAAARDYECMNALFCTTTEQWPESGVSWSGKRGLKVFSLRID